MPYLLIAITTVSTLFLSVGCNKTKSTDAADPSENTQKESPDDPEKIIPGALAITTPEKAMLYVQSALQSTVAVSEEISATKAGNIAIALAEIDDPACFEGTPKNVDEKCIHHAEQFPDR